MSKSPTSSAYNSVYIAGIVFHAVLWCPKINSADVT